MKYNETQKLVSLISGYEYEGEQGARDEGYYEISNMYDRLHYLLDVVLHSRQIDVTANIFEANKFLRKKFSSSFEQDEAFKNLK